MSRARLSACARVSRSVSDCCSMDCIGLSSPTSALCRSCCNDGFVPGRERPRSSCCRSCCFSRVGPTSRRRIAVIDTGCRKRDSERRVEPKRSLTSYVNRCVAGSKPRTKRSDWLGWITCPHPRMSSSPWMSRSSPPSGFCTWNDSVARCGRPIFTGLKEIDRFADVVHGPVHELRAASRPSCDARQRRASGVALASSDVMPAASVGSVVAAGSKTNARSLP